MFRVSLRNYSARFGLRPLAPSSSSSSVSLGCFAQQTRRYSSEEEEEGEGEGDEGGASISGFGGIVPVDPNAVNAGGSNAVGTPGTTSTMMEISQKFTADLEAASAVARTKVQVPLAPGIGVGAPVPHRMGGPANTEEHALALPGQGDFQGLGDFASPLGGGAGPIPTAPTSSTGPGSALAAPTTKLTEHCNMLSECMLKAQELYQQMKAQEYGGASAQVMPQEGMEEFMEELRTTAVEEVGLMVGNLKGDPTLIQCAGIHELRRTLYYGVNLREKNWLSTEKYEPIMRMLTVEFMRRDNEACLTPDDVLFISTHVVMSNFYNRQLWARMEGAMTDGKIYEHIDLASIKTLTTKLYRSRRQAGKEGMEIRRKILTALGNRVAELANDFDLPTLLGILQCYTTHNVLPTRVESLAHRSINHIADCTPLECSTLANIFKRWKLMRLEVCEKLIDRICTAETLTSGMAQAASASIKTCFQRVAEGGKNAMSAEPTKQKLRALGEQVGGRLDEVKWPNVLIIIGLLDTLVQLKIYVPKRCMLSIFAQATTIIEQMVDEGHGPKNEKSGGQGRLITAEEARQMLALLGHYGKDLSPELDEKLKEALKEGIFPDEASVGGIH